MRNQILGIVNIVVPRSLFSRGFAVMWEWKGFIEGDMVGVER